MDASRNPDQERRRGIASWIGATAWAVLSSHRVAVILFGILILDGISVADLRHPRNRGGYHPPRVGIVKSEAGLALAGDDDADMVGMVLCFNLRPRAWGTWAATYRPLDPQVDFMPVGNFEPDAKELAQIRALYADWLEASWHDPELASVVRANVTGRSVPIISGYIHNAVTSLVAAAFIASVSCCVVAGYRRGRSVRRTSAGHCPMCDYDLAATPPGAECPECGFNPSADETGDTGRV